jgi:hypothetical protein
MELFLALMVLPCIIIIGMIFGPLILAAYLFQQGSVLLACIVLALYFMVLGAINRHR